MSKSREKIGVYQAQMYHGKTKEERARYKQKHREAVREHLREVKQKVSKRRVSNILHRFLNGEEFYTNSSPRISYLEISAVEYWVDVGLQIEHTHGAQAGLIAVYPVHSDKFKVKAEAWLRSQEEGD